MGRAEAISKGDALFPIEGQHSSEWPWRAETVVFPTKNLFEPGNVNRPVTITGVE
jgi:hypothetical protein